MTSDENRQTLQRAGGQYIPGEKLRGVHLNAQALTRGGRLEVIRDNLHIKEVYVGEGAGRRRFIIAYNPERAEHDRQIRERNLQRLEAANPSRIPYKFVGTTPESRVVDRFMFYLTLREVASHATYWCKYCIFRIFFRQPIVIVCMP